MLRFIHLSESVLKKFCLSDTCKSNNLTNTLLKLRSYQT